MHMDKKLSMLDKRQRTTLPIRLLLTFCSILLRLQLAKGWSKVWIEMEGKWRRQFFGKNRRNLTATSFDVIQIDRHKIRRNFASRFQTKPHSRGKKQNPKVRQKGHYRAAFF